MEKLKILIIDDEKSYREQIGDFLELNNYITFKAELPSEAFKILQKNIIDIVLLDLKLPEMNGIEVLKKIKESHPETEVILMTGHGDMDSVIQAIKLGATDFFTKPFRLIDMQTAIERTSRYIDLQNRLKDIKLSYSVVSRELKEKSGHQMIGNSLAMKSIIELISKVAKTDKTSILITGESGTGKELVARGIHYLSSRKNAYFYDVNCSAVPENLFESEFFGHKKGAFTDARENKSGWFEIAHKGTLFLDEIADMPLTQQMKLLRVLEENKIRRIGSHQEIDIDVRVIAATNQQIEKMVEEKKFRIDLFHRLNSFIIHLPPLRERKEDIPILFEHFVRFYAERMKKPIMNIDKNIFIKLSQYKFPGNIRELKNIAERAVILCERNKLKLNEVIISKTKNKEDFIDTEDLLNLDVIEKQTILKALERTNYVQIKAAELLNISRHALSRKM
ncbi:MAG TPA: sigma-54-dependent Fis family transcriptional regulator, partial [Candidatus Cloacimonetes bacterium]|nr:sigma-54-dependent Fis family transcriptional regulator [Candidatus Cloacimonadota bacterium]